MLSVALILLLAAGSCVDSLNLVQPESVVVQPGQSLTITCQVSGYSLTDDTYATGWIRQCEGKQMDWISHQWGGGTLRQNSALKNKFSYNRDTSAATVTLKGQNVQPEDTAVYYCTRRPAIYSGAFDYWGKGTMVTVTSATPSGPTVFPLSQCGSGTDNTITLACYATGFTPASLTYAWTKEGTAWTNSVQYPPVQKNSLYSGISQIQVSKQDARKPFQCVVTHAAGSGVCSFSPIIEVVYQLPTLSVLASSSDNKSEASFSCFAKDFSPKDHKLTWLKDNEDITNKIYEITTPVVERTDESGNTVYSVASFLSVLSDGLSQGTQFTCLFEGKGEGDIKTYVNESVSYGCPIIPPCPGGDSDITIIGPANEDMFMSGKGKIVCQVLENKPSVTSVLWQDENGHTLIEYSKSTDNGKKVINLALDITYNEWNQGIKRYCVVEHSEWLEPVKKIYERRTGQTQRPSVFMMPPVEHTRKEMVTLTCFVKDFFPQEVYVSWLVDDEEVDSTYEFHTTNAVESYGSYSAYSQLLLSLQQWKRNDVVYSCVVHHESVDNTTKAIVRSIGYRTFEKNTNLVNLNMNVPNTCKPQ